MDFEKAFDTVPHKRLISKLLSYSVNSKLIKYSCNQSIVHTKWRCKHLTIGMFKLTDITASHV